MVEPIRVDGDDCAPIILEFSPHPDMIEANMDTYFVDRSTLGGRQGGWEGEVRLFQQAGD